MIREQNLHPIFRKDLSIFLDLSIKEEDRLTYSDIGSIVSDVYKIITPENENHSLFDHTSLDKDLPKEVYSNIDRWMNKLWDASLSDHFSQEVSLGGGYTKILSTLYKYYMFRHETSNEEYKIPVVFTYPEMSLHPWLLDIYLRFHIVAHHERDVLITTRETSVVKSICKHLWDCIDSYEDSSFLARIYFKSEGMLKSTLIDSNGRIIFTEEFEEALPSYAQDLVFYSNQI